MATFTSRGRRRQHRSGGRPRDPARHDSGCLFRARSAAKRHRRMPRLRNRHTLKSRRAGAWRLRLVEVMDWELLDVWRALKSSVAELPEHLLKTLLDKAVERLTRFPKSRSRPTPRRSGRPSGRSIPPVGCHRCPCLRARLRTAPACPRQTLSRSPTAIRSSLCWSRTPSLPGAPSPNQPDGSGGRSCVITARSTPISPPPQRRKRRRLRRSSVKAQRPARTDEWRRGAADQTRRARSGPHRPSCPGSSEAAITRAASSALRSK